MIAAIGSVLARKKVLAATIMTNGRLCPTSLGEYLNTLVQSHTAGAIMLKTLNNTRTAFPGPWFLCRRHCTNVGAQPIIMVSAGESSSTLSKVNRKFTDIEASVPGRVILRPDASNAVSRYVQKRRWSAEYQSRSDSANNTMPILAVEAINSFAWILICGGLRVPPY